MQEEGSAPEHSGGEEPRKDASGSGTHGGDFSLGVHLMFAILVTVIPLSPQAPVTVVPVLPSTALTP